MFFFKLMTYNSYQLSQNCYITRLCPKEMWQDLWTWQCGSLDGENKRIMTSRWWLVTLVVWMVCRLGRNLKLLSTTNCSKRKKANRIPILDKYAWLPWCVGQCVQGSGTYSRSRCCYPFADDSNFTQLDYRLRTGLGPFRGFALLPYWGNHPRPPPNKYNASFGQKCATIA